METVPTLRVIAHIHTEFPQKFGLPRQSGLVPTRARIVMEPAYRQPEALRGIDGFSHIWLLWQFSESLRDTWSPTVRPPRLGGNTRMGVFATRSPFRPNAIGLSSVRLDAVEWETPNGPVLWVSGADLLDGTPLYDIKPYLAYTDAHPEASGGFAAEALGERLRVRCPEEWERVVPEERRAALHAVLAQDPRPAYQEDPERVYGFVFAGCHVHFRVAGETLYVTEITRTDEEPPCGAEGQKG